MASAKKKLNLTIDSELLERAKQVAETRGESLSSLVEDFLAKLTMDTNYKDSDWLKAFHQKYLCGDYVEATDQTLITLRKEIKNKYS